MVENSTDRTADRTFPRRQRHIDFAAKGLRLALRLHFQLRNPGLVCAFRSFSQSSTRQHVACMTTVVRAGMNVGVLRQILGRDTSRLTKKRLSRSLAQYQILRIIGAQRRRTGKRESRHSDRTATIEAYECSSRCESEIPVPATHSLKRPARIGRHCRYPYLHQTLVGL